MAPWNNRKSLKICYCMGLFVLFCFGAKWPICECLPHGGPAWLAVLISFSFQGSRSLLLADLFVSQHLWERQKLSPWHELSLSGGKLGCGDAQDTEPSLC